MTLICAKFGADLINTSKVTSRKTVAVFFGPPSMPYVHGAAALSVDTYARIEKMLYARAFLSTQL